MGDTCTSCGAIIHSIGEGIWPGWQPGQYQAHFIHTGAGEAIFHIFPDGTTLLLDCGDHPAITRLELAVPIMPGPQRLAGDWIARYIQRVLPTNAPQRNGRPLVDYMMLSHFHDDHSGTPIWQSIKADGKGIPGCCRSGFGLAAEELAFDTAIDRGWPDYDDPTPEINDVAERDHMRSLYAALQARDGLHVEKFRLGDHAQLAMRRNPAAFGDFSITNITANGRILCKDGHIRNLYTERLKKGGALNENGMSLGLLIRYGDFTLYTAGDFSDTALNADGSRFQTEDALAEELMQVEIAKINHHGHRSMPEKIVRALAPQAWIACVWDQLHTLDEVLERLSDRALYPDSRIHFPTVFPLERIKQAAGKPFLADIAPETFVNGAHVVVTVPRGGKTYRISCLTAEDESMRILGEYAFTTRS